MNRSRFKRMVRWLPLFLAVGLTLSALVVTSLVALLAPHRGIPVSDPPLGNLLTVIRSYVFRKALINTAIEVAVVGASVLIIALVVTSSLRVDDLRRRRWLCALSVTPLLLPVPYATLLWRPMLEQVDIVQVPNRAILAGAAVQVWRLWPLAIFALPIVHWRGRGRAALAAALAAMWIALTDAGTQLLYTGGEPFNATHLWATWAFHSIWVSRLWAYGAVLIGGLAVLSLLLGWLFLRTLAAPGSPTSLSPRSSARKAPLVLIAGSLAAALPLVLMLWRVIARQAGVWAFGHTMVLYWQWALNTVLVAAIAMVVALWIAAPAIAADTRLRQSTVAAALLTGLAGMPVWQWIAVRWPSSAGDSLGILVFGLIVGIIAGPIALWPAYVSVRHVSNGRSREVFSQFTLPIVWMIVANQFSLAIALSGSEPSYTLASGVALQLAGIDALSARLEAASLTTFAVVFAAAYAFTRWKFRTRNRPGV